LILYTLAYPFVGSMLCFCCFFCNDHFNVWAEENVGGDTPLVNCSKSIQ